MRPMNYAYGYEQKYNDYKFPYGYGMNIQNQISNNYQTNCILVFFKLCGLDSGLNNPIIIRCNPNEKVSELIERYRNESNDYDPLKRFIFLEKDLKDLDQRTTISEAGIRHNSNIFVIPTRDVVGAGYAMMFTDLSKNKTKELGFSPNAPLFRSVTRGINIFGICNFRNCVAYRNEVVVKINRTKFDLIKERDLLFCPECQSPIIPKTIGFYLCRFQISGKKLENNRIETFMNPPDEARNFNSVKYFDPDLNGEVMLTELNIEVLEYL